VPPEGLPRSLAITGLGTFVGFQVADRLADGSEAPRIVGLDLRLPRRLEGRIRFHRVDLTEPTADTAVAEILEKERCDAILHCAFHTDPHPDVEYAHELEVIGSLHVMNACAAVNVQKLIVMSTAQAYGASPRNPAFLTEEHALNPDPEAHVLQDRAEVESLLQLFADRHPDLAVTVLRPCWVIGPTIETHVTQHFENTNVITLLGYDPLLQLLHEEDLLRAVGKALVLDARGPINLASPTVLPLSTLLRVAGKEPRALPHPLLYWFSSLAWLRSTGDPPRAFYDFLRFGWTVDITRAKEILEFEPVYTTKEAWMSFVVSRRLRRYR
jgi:UDP-glucose 4-epimerase